LKKINTALNATKILLTDTASNTPVRVFFIISNFKYLEVGILAYCFLLYHPAFIFAFTLYKTAVIAKIYFFIRVMLFLFHCIGKRSAVAV
jgi:hypothetical protein